MRKDNLRYKFERLLSLADVEIDGQNPWDIQVYNDNLYTRVAAGGSLALGKSYMDGWWDCPELDEFFCKILRAKLDVIVKGKTWYFHALKAKLFNLQKPSCAYQVGQHHYDIGNNLYQIMLDKRMIYSCGYWENASNLDEAQEAKLNLICQKLDLQPGMRVLDIGCGWGGTAKFIAERYNIEVVGITVSKQQVNFGKDLCRGLPVDIRLQDYRKIEGTFDRIISIGMFEHVGYKNYGIFMRIAKNCLKENGLFLLHTIGRNRYINRYDPWCDRYIFPNYMLPSPRHIASAAEGLFVVEDWHNFGTDYDNTLMQWFWNFHENWDILSKYYNERFYRMWKYYLLSCAGSFRARRTHVWQLVLSPKGVLGGYRAKRYRKAKENAVTVNS